MKGLGTWDRNVLEQCFSKRVLRILTITTEQKDPAGSCCCLYLKNIEVETTEQISIRQFAGLLKMPWKSRKDLECANILSLVATEMFFLERLMKLAPCRDLVTTTGPVGR